MYPIIANKKIINSKSYEIYNKLRESITYGHLSPGEKIVASKLEKEFGASRTPIREAIKQLADAGYVEIFHNTGAFVRKISPGEIEKVYDVLSVLEGYAVRLAAENITNLQINGLEQLNYILKECKQLQKYKEYIEKNNEFHLNICRFSGNEILGSLISWLRDRVYRYRFLGIIVPGHIEEFISDHDQILEALREKDPEKTEQIMRLHVLRLKKILVNILAEFQL